MCCSLSVTEEQTLPQTVADHHSNPWLAGSAPVLLLNSELSQNEANEVTFNLSEQQTKDNDQSLEVEKMTSSIEKQSSDITSSIEKQSSDITSSVIKDINPTSFLTPHKMGMSLGVANQQLLHVHEAFAGDDVVKEFEEEKNEQTNTTQDIILQLPGMYCNTSHTLMTCIVLYI